MKLFTSENGERIIMMILLSFLYVLPFFFEIVHQWIYIIGVLVGTYFVVRHMIDSMKPKRKFLRQWYRHRKRSPHLNGMIYAGHFLISIITGTFIGPWVVEGRLIPVLELHMAALVFFSGVLLVMSIGFGYLRIPMNERRYEELIDKFERRGEDLAFIKEAEF